ncbi:MAG: hypothetical protein ABI318_21920, partial [Chthoniobacteraceae bacterium]
MRIKPKLRPGIHAAVHRQLFIPLFCVSAEADIGVARLLEPVHKIEARIPEECVGRLRGDLSSRRGSILGVDVDGAFQVIRAEVPAKELYRYSSQLRTLTGGRGVNAIALHARQQDRIRPRQAGRDAMACPEAPARGT